MKWKVVEHILLISLCICLFFHEPMQLLNIHEEQSSFACLFSTVLLSFLSSKYIENGQGTIMDKEIFLPKMLNFFLGQNVLLVSLLDQINVFIITANTHVQSKLTFPIDFSIGYILMHSSTQHLMVFSVSNRKIAFLC